MEQSDLNGAGGSCVAAEGERGRGRGEGRGVDMRTGRLKHGGEKPNDHTLSLIHSALGRSPLPTSMTDRLTSLFLSSSASAPRHTAPPPLPSSSDSF